MSSLVYLQSDKPLANKISKNLPASTFMLNSEICIQLLKPIYGLADCVDKWYRILHDHIKADVKIELTIIDVSLYCKFDDYDLIGINGSKVDDPFCSNTDEWMQEANKTGEKF